MNNLSDYLKQRADDLELSRGDDLVLIQRHLDGLYAGQARATHLGNGQLRIVTPNAVLASELRLRQVALVSELAGILGNQAMVTKIIIQIRTISGQR